MKVDINKIAKQFEPKESSTDNTKWYYPQHNPVTNESYRWLLCAPSGGGKTSILLECILDMSNWDKIYLVSSTLEQPKYKAFTSILQRAEEYMNTAIKKQLPTNSKYEKLSMLRTFSSLEQFIEEGGIDILDSKYKNLLILDDVLAELMLPKNKQLMTNIFIKLRHHNTSVAILTQGYVDVPKIIRQNCNIFSLFNLNKRAIRSICQDLGGECDTQELHDAYNRCMSTNKFAFLHISKQSPNIQTRYRCGLQGINLIRK